ncbi:sodium-translocating pyrophosphatase [Candidatus Micrarchaeota archaeon CG1_02_49_24]|nr:MAG: sodium-translocating pyrophosphatase [Candidatus Micrarchaeota archaeon CG1_02_49_24]HII54339.1 sodium-translocating pyrophosphatase [Candidatus Micrarchaeota archaeon]
MDAIALQNLIYIAPAAGIISIAVSLYLFFALKKLPAGNEKMQEIASAIKEGAMAYLNRQNKTIALFAGIIIAVFAILGIFVDKLWLAITLSFAVGAICSAIAGYIGMSVTTLANVRTAEAARKGLQHSLDAAFKAGAVMGFAVVGLGLIGISVLYFGFGWLISIGVFAAGADKMASLLQMLTGMGFGASLIAMFARVGGGIYTKGADVGADLVGKVESGIPEDDPRNPAVIADNVGDNVGDCAGMGADLFESYVVTIIGTLLLGYILKGAVGVVFPFVIAGGAVAASILGMFAVKTKEDGNPLTALNNGILVTALISAVLFYFITGQLFPVGEAFGIFASSAIGLVVAVAIMYITDYFTSTQHRPVQDIAEAAKTGAGTNIIAGLAVGLESTAPFILVIALGILLSYALGGIYGVTVAAMSLLSLTAIIVAVDTFGPVSDNAGGIAEMAGLDEGVRKITDKLDAVGNTTKATTKGFAIASAGLAALALMLAFANEVNVAATAAGLEGFAIDKAGLPVISILKPDVLIGLFIGGVLPFIFSAYSMKAVGKAAGSIIEEVRRQFREMPGIMLGTQKPDYARCVDISTQVALRELAVPGMIAVGTPLIIGFVLGVDGVIGLLAGSLVSAQALAVFMSNAGGAWDNGKKLIEQSGRKGSDQHKAAVVGDTVGDPLKDTSGPALNPMIKILNTIAILFVALFVKYALNVI